MLKEKKITQVDDVQLPSVHSMNIIGLFVRTESSSGVE